MGERSQRGARHLLYVILVCGLLLVACGSGDKSAEQPVAPGTAAEETGDVPAGEEPIIIDYAFFAPAHTFPAVQIERWAEELHDRTGGRVEVRTYHGGSLLTADDMFDGVLAGVAHAGLGPPLGDPGRFPLLSGTTLPVGFPNATVVNQVVWDLIHEFEPAELDGYKLLVVSAAEPHYFMVSFPVESLDDVRGRTVRAVGGDVPIVEALGGNPVGMAMPEVPEAMATGVIQGAVSSREVMLDFQLEHTRTVIDYPLGAGTMIGVMDLEFYESLPEDVQQVIDELGQEMSIFAGQYHDSENIARSMEWAVEELGAEVVALSEEDQAKLASISETIIAEWIADIEARGLPGRQFVERMLELKDAYSQ